MLKTLYIRFCCSSIPHSMQNLALFISGGGSTATAIIHACKPGGILHKKVKPVLVVASTPKAAGIGRVTGTMTLDSKDIIVISPNDYRNADLTRNADRFGEALMNACEKRNVTLFGQYGWLAKTPANFLRVFPNGINQHPAPLCPGEMDFGGKGMYGRRCHLAVLLFRRLTERDFWTTATAQQVSAGYDEGAILRQERVDIFPDDDVEALQARVLPAEHRVQINTLLDSADGIARPFHNDPLVLPHEEEHWVLSRKMAILAYPKG